MFSPPSSPLFLGTLKEGAPKVKDLWLARIPLLKIQVAGFCSVISIETIIVVVSVTRSLWSATSTVANAMFSQKIGGKRSPRNDRTENFSYFDGYYEITERWKFLSRGKGLGTVSRVDAACERTGTYSQLVSRALARLRNFRYSDIGYHKSLFYKRKPK